MLIANNKNLCYIIRVKFGMDNPKFFSKTMAKCQVCGKRSSAGRNSKHRRGVASKKFSRRAKKTSKVFKPNIQKTTVVVGGLKMKMRLCTSCLKKMKNKAKAEKKEKEGKKEAKEKKTVKPAKSKPKKTGKK